MESRHPFLKRMPDPKKMMDKVCKESGHNYLFFDPVSIFEPARKKELSAGQYYCEEKIFDQSKKQHRMKVLKDTFLKKEEDRDDLAKERIKKLKELNKQMNMVKLPSRASLFDAKKFVYWEGIQRRRLIKELRYVIASGKHSEWRAKTTRIIHRLKEFVKLEGSDQIIEEILRPEAINFVYKKCKKMKFDQYRSEED